MPKIFLSHIREENKKNFEYVLTHFTDVCQRQLFAFMTTTPQMEQQSWLKKQMQL